MRLRMLFALFLTLPIITGNEIAAAKPKEAQKIAVYPKKCQQDLRYGPGKKFAVYVFCDDAMGTTIGIINTQPGFYLGPGSEKAWALENRFWQEASWARDVHSIEWSEDGLRLTVWAGAVYGTNKKYVLDLVRRKIESETNSPGYGWVEKEGQ
jgi:hypothetical protein